MAKPNKRYLTHKELVNHLVKQLAENLSRKPSDYQNPRNMSGGKAKNEAQDKRNKALDKGWEIIKKLIADDHLDKDAYKTSDGGAIIEALERLEKGEGSASGCSCGKGSCDGSCDGSHGSGGKCAGKCGGSHGSGGKCDGKCSHKKP